MMTMHPLALLRFICQRGGMSEPRASGLVPLATVVQGWEARREAEHEALLNHFSRVLTAILRYERPAQWLDADSVIAALRSPDAAFTPAVGEGVLG
jgi:hypothetical protein